MRTTTLTVEDTNGSIQTTLHADEEDALAALRSNYGKGGEYDEVDDHELIQTLIDEQGLVIYVEEHEVPEPTPDPPAERTHTFLLAANVRSWTRFEVTGLSAAEAAALDSVDYTEALAMARALDEAGRLRAQGVEYEEAAPIWDEAAEPAVIEFEAQD